MNQIADLRAHGHDEEADAIELARSAEGRAEALRRVDAALELIERAQHDLERASQELSGLVGGIAAWRRTGAAAERAHELWRWLSYQFLPKHGARLVLDGSAALAFLRRRRDGDARKGST